MEANPEYTLSDYAAAFRRRRRVLFAAAIPVVAVAAAFSLMLPDEYTSYAEIDVDLEGSNVRTLNPIELTTYADQYIAKLEDRVLTREHLVAIANDPEVFPPSEEPLDESDRIGQIRDSINISVLTQLVLSPTTGREVDLISGIKVASVAADPEFVFGVADRLARLFLQEDRLTRTERASSTSVFLNKQMRISEDQILSLEKVLSDFKVANACCLPELVELNMSVIQRAERDIENSQPRIRTLEQNKNFIQSQLEELGQLDAAPDRMGELEQEYMSLVANYGPDHPDVVRVRREIIGLTSAGPDVEGTFEILELKIRLSEAEQRYSSEHPDVIRYKNDLEALERKRGIGRNTVQNPLVANPRYQQLRSDLNSLNTELVELQRRQPTLRQKIEDYEDRLARTPQIDSKYQAINRGLRSAQENFDDLQRRAIMAQQSEALESTDIGARLAQVRAASVPRSPSGPARTAILILGVFLAVTLGFGSMLFAEMADSTVRGSKDIASVMNMVPLATVPVIENSLSRSQRKRQLNLFRGTSLLVIVAILLIYFGGFS